MTSTERPGGRGLAHGLVETLRSRILDGSLAPGTKLPSEKELIEEFGVSRTVVRDALTRLQAAGVVETFQGRGSFVLALPEPTVFRGEAARVRTHHDVIAMMEFRVGVESEAAGLAAVRASADDVAALTTALDHFAHGEHDGPQGAVEADFAFHLAVARASGNRFFAELVESLGPMMIMLPRTQLDTPYTTGDAAHLTRVVTEHQNVLDAVAAGEPEAARAAMRVHLTSSRLRLRAREG